MVITCLHQAHQGGGSGVVSFIAFMSLVYDLLDDTSINAGMDVIHAKLILKHVLDRHEDTAEAVNNAHVYTSGTRSAVISWPNAVNETKCPEPPGFKR